MTKAIKEKIEKCPECRKYLPSQPQQPIVNQNHATAPMQVLGTDLFEIGKKHYLIVVDQYSGLPFVFPLNKLNTAAIVKHIRELALEHGLPEQIISDGGPQFRSDFNKFCDELYIRKHTTDPYYPQANGAVERGVQMIR